MREEPQRIAGRLQATLRIPDVAPTAIVVVAHALPTHGGTMRNPLIAAIARACASHGWYALRFNFRGVGESAGDWSGGRDEPQDVADAVRHARDVAPALPVGVSGYSFGALMTLKWLASGGQCDDVALVAPPLRSVSLQPQDMPPVPDRSFIVAAEHDQFGTAAEIRVALPRARVAEVRESDHFFVRRHHEVAEIVARHFAETFPVASPHDDGGRGTG